MPEYQYLSDDDKAKIAAEVLAAVPDHEANQRARERDHYRQTLLFKAGLADDPGELYDPSADVAAAEAVAIAIEAEVAKLVITPPIADVAPLEPPIIEKG